MERFQRLSLADLTNLAEEAPDTPMHQGALGVLDGALLRDDGTVDIERVRAHVSARLARVPELRRMLRRTAPLEGRPLWVDDPGFSIDRHVLLHRLNPPGGEPEALRFAEERMAGLMDRSHPLWELWLLEGYGAGKVGIFFKVHHVFADGPAILNIVARLFDVEPRVDTLPIDGWSPSPAPSWRALVAENLARKTVMWAGAVRRVLHPRRLARACKRSALSTWEAFRQGRGAPHTSLNRPIGPRRRVAVLRLDLEEVRRSAHARGATVNDVFLALIAAGLREVMRSRGEKLERPLHASMAVSMRGSAESAIGNHVGTMVVRLPVEIADGERLAAVAAASRAAKSRQEAAVPQTLMVLLAMSRLMRVFIRHQHLVNVLATNLRGPAFPLYIAGSRLEDAVAVPPIAGNVTVSFAALSYSGRLDVSVHADADAWPDLDLLVEAMDRAWSALRTAVAREPAALAV